MVVDMKYTIVCVLAALFGGYLDACGWTYKGWRFWGALVIFTAFGISCYVFRVA